MYIFLFIFYFSISLAGYHHGSSKYFILTLSLPSRLLSDVTDSNTCSMTILFILLEYLHYFIFLRLVYWLSFRKIAFLGVRWEFVKDSILVNWYWFNHICMLWSRDELGYYVLYYSMYFPLKNSHPMKPMVWGKVTGSQTCTYLPK